MPFSRSWSHGLPMFRFLTTLALVSVLVTFTLKASPVTSTAFSDDLNTATEKPIFKLCGMRFLDVFVEVCEIDKKHRDVGDQSELSCHRACLGFSYLFARISLKYSPKLGFRFGKFCCFCCQLTMVVSAVRRVLREYNAMKCCRIGCTTTDVLALCP